MFKLITERWDESFFLGKSPKIPNSVSKTGNCVFFPDTQVDILVLTWARSYIVFTRLFGFQRVNCYFDAFVSEGFKRIVLSRSRSFFLNAFFWLNLNIYLKHIFFYYHNMIYVIATN